MNQPAKRIDLRKEMPKTADMVDRRRAEWGAVYVNDCIRRGIAGESNCFYASENGKTLGTAFTGPISEDVAWFMVTFGVEAMCFFKQPGAVDGTN